MQIFQLKLVFKKEEKYIDKKFYYSILGAVLSFFENNDIVYNSILKISYSFDKEHLFIFISVLGKEKFNLVVNMLLENKKQIFTVDKYCFKFEKIDFNLKVFDLDNIQLSIIDRFSLKFLSPTQIRNQNKIFTLPESDRFLFSVYQKIKKLGLEFDIDEKDFKKWLKYSIIVNKFDIKTDLVEIKGAKRAGVIGNISYIVYEKNEDYQKILDLIVKVIPYTGVGSSTKLGLGNVKTIL